MSPPMKLVPLAFLCLVLIHFEYSEAKATCEFQTQHDGCWGLIEDPKRSTWEECSKACCDDGKCNMWQFRDNECVRTGVINNWHGISAHGITGCYRCETRGERPCGNFTYGGILEDRERTYFGLAPIFLFYFFCTLVYIFVCCCACGIQKKVIVLPIRKSECGNFLKPFDPEAGRMARCTLDPQWMSSMCDLCNYVLGGYWLCCIAWWGKNETWTWKLKDPEQNRDWDYEHYKAQGYYDADKISQRKILASERTRNEAAKHELDIKLSQGSLTPAQQQMMRDKSVVDTLQQKNKESGVMYIAGNIAL